MGSGPIARWTAGAFVAVALVVAAAVLLGGRTPASHASPAAKPKTPSWKCPGTRTAVRGSGLKLPAYSATSPFNRAIPSDAVVADGSDASVQGLVSASGGGGFLVALQRWTVAVYYADSKTPKVKVPITASWAQGLKSITGLIPVPSAAKPDPSTDGHMAVIDRAANCEYDFFNARYDESGKLVAGWENSIRLDGTGVFPRGLSARGSGFALLGGLIFPAELRSGEINHALVFSYPDVKVGGPVRPATESDGQSTVATALPEGTLVRLDPSLDLSTLGLTPYERTIARALQAYGMYLADHGGNSGITLYAVNPLSYRGKPYTGLLPDEVYVSLGHIPVDRFQVLLPLAP